MFWISSYKKHPWLFFCLIPIIFLGFVLYKNLINIPSGDDVYVMDMFNQLALADTLWEKSGIFFAQHNEHRLVLTRLLAWLQYSSVGYIDLRWWIILGNMSLGVMVIFYYQHIGDHPSWIIPVAFVLICPASNTLIAMQNSNLFSALFAVATLHFSLKKLPHHFILALACSAFSIFSNSGGFALLPVVSIIYFFHKRYRLLSIWGFWGLFLVGGYYWHYEKIYRHPTSQHLFEQVPKALEFFLAFIGSIGFNPVLAQVAGVLFLGVCCWAVYQKYYLQNPFVFVCMMYCLLMACMTTFKRYEYGLNTALSERYAIYSMLLTASIIIMISHFLKQILRLQKIAFFTLTLLTILINLKYVTLHLRNPEGRKGLLMSKIENYQLNHSGFNCWEINSLDKLSKNGLYSYQLPAPLHPKTYYDSLNRAAITHITIQVDTVYQNKTDFHLTGIITNPPTDIVKISQVPHRLMVIHNLAIPFDCSRNELTEPQNDNTLILDMELENDHHKKQLPNFCFTLPKKHFKKGRYGIYFLFMNDDPVNHQPIKSNIEFEL